MQLIEYDEEATTESICIFEEGEAIVWGLIVVSIEEKIVEVIGLPIVGEHYTNVHDAILDRAQFFIPSDHPLDITNKGCKRMFLPLSYNELAINIVNYFTYEGRFSYLACTSF